MQNESRRILSDLEWSEILHKNRSQIVNWLCYSDHCFEADAEDALTEAYMKVTGRADNLRLDKELAPMTDAEAVYHLKKYARSRLGKIMAKNSYWNEPSSWEVEKGTAECKRRRIEALAFHLEGCQNAARGNLTLEERTAASRMLRHRLYDFCRAHCIPECRRDAYWLMTAGGVSPMAAARQLFGAGQSERELQKTTNMLKTMKKRMNEALRKELAGDRFVRELLAA